MGVEKRERKKVTKVATQNLRASSHLRYILEKHRSKKGLWHTEQSQFTIQYQYR
jgi:hypothetical protein